MKQNQSSFAAFIGLDKSDKKINVSLQRCGKSKIERSVIKGGAEALHVWVAALCARFPGERIALCLEQPAAGLIHALMGYDFIVLFPINPVTLARYREAFIPSRAKDDPTDADFCVSWWRCIASNSKRGSPMMFALASCATWWKPGAEA